MDKQATFHANHNLQTLLYVSNLAIAGERPLLLSMGLRDDQIEVFRNLSIDDAWTLASNAHTHLATIRFEADLVDVALKNAQRKRLEATLIDELIRAGASGSLMLELFGLLPRDYAQRRSVLGFDEGEGVGRPAKPSDDKQAEIWTSWQSHRDCPRPERYLAVHRDSRIPVRVIHAVVSYWEESNRPEPRPTGGQHDS